MQRMTQAQFESLTHAARTLSADEHGVKVLVTPDDRVIKLFRRKRLMSSALWFPYARCFEFAARELAARGIPAVRVEQVARVPSLRRDLVVYRRLDGATLREALASNHDDNGERLLPLLASFLAMLHERGVYFRAVHFGNVLVQASEEGQPRLALIDVSESRFRRGPLSPTLPRPKPSATCEVCRGSISTAGIRPPSICGSLSRIGPTLRTCRATIPQRADAGDPIVRVNAGRSESVVSATSLGGPIATQREARYAWVPHATAFAAISISNRSRAAAVGDLDHARRPAAHAAGRHYPPIDDARDVVDP